MERNIWRPIRNLRINTPEDDTQAKLDARANEIPDVDAALEELKIPESTTKHRTPIRRQITVICKSINNLVEKRGSRRAAQALVNLAVELRSQADRDKADLTDEEADPNEFDYQFQLHLNYLTAVQAAKEQAEQTTTHLLSVRSSVASEA